MNARYGTLVETPVVHQLISGISQYGITCQRGHANNQNKPWFCFTVYMLYDILMTAHKTWYDSADRQP